MHRLSLIGLFLAASAAPALAQSTQATPPQPPAADEIVVERQLKEKEKKVCKSSVATGSIMPKKVCRSQAQWDEIRERDIAALERMKDEKEARDHVAANRDAGR